MKKLPSLSRLMGVEKRDGLRGLNTERDFIAREIEISRGALGELPEGYVGHSIHRDDLDRWVVVKYPKGYTGPKSTVEPEIDYYTFRDKVLYRLSHGIHGDEHARRQLQLIPLTDLSEIKYVSDGVLRYNNAVQRMYNPQQPKQ